MTEISSIQAGSYNTPNYPIPSNSLGGTVFTSATTAPMALNDTIAADLENVSISGDNTSSGVDARTNTKFDRRTTNTQSLSFTFSDFLDTINPLEHIPVVSSVYRAVTGEHINPIARIAGDMMYGGILGLASAGLAAAGAVADTIVEAETGKSTASNIASMLGMGPDADDTQLADTAPPRGITSIATSSPTPLTSFSASTNTVQSSNLDDETKVNNSIVSTPPTVQSKAAPATKVQSPTPLPNQPTAAPLNNTVSSNTLVPSLAPSAPSLALTANTANGLPLTTAKAFPLDRAKLPYGGVMDMSSVIEAQNQAIALSEGSHAMRLGHTIYTGRLMTGAHALPVAPTPDVASAKAPPSEVIATISNPSLVAVSTATANAGIPNSGDLQATQNQTQLPQALLDDIAALKALNQYRSTASSPSSLGSSVNLTN